MSPMVAAIFVGLSLGQSADRHVQPFVRENISKLRLSLEGINTIWISYGIKNLSQAVCVALALVNAEMVTIFSGSLLGAELLTGIGVRHLHAQIQRLAQRSEHALLQKAAANFNPRHRSIHAAKYFLAILAFFSQLGKLSGNMSLPFRLILFLPLAVERSLISIKDAMIHRMD